MSPGIFVQPEGFKLMQYQCDALHREVVWNSRNGVTPFGIGCRFCSRIAQHVRWNQDIYAPEFNPPKGQRYFRDGLPEEAAAIIRARIERMRDEYPITPQEEVELIRSVRGDQADEEGGEFSRGWPKLVTRGDDNDTLTLPLMDATLSPYAPLPRTVRRA